MQDMHVPTLAFFHASQENICKFCASRRETNMELACSFTNSTKKKTHTWLSMSTSLPLPSSPHCAPRTMSMPYLALAMVCLRASSDCPTYFLPAPEVEAEAEAPDEAMPMDSSILETREEISPRRDMTVGGFSPDSHWATLFSELLESRYVAPDAPPMALPAARRAVLPEVAAILLNMLFLF